MSLKILTWHVHGNYLYYLSQTAHDFYLPVRSDGSVGYGGRGSSFPFGANVHEVDWEAVREMQFDCILFQSRRNYTDDQFEILTAEQRELPRIYLEHDPPQEHPTNTRHPVDDRDVLLVHVTHFNALMWDPGATPVRVIEHGVLVPEGVQYTGELPRGIAVVNHLARRGRRLGADVFVDARAAVPLDLVGMDAESLGGLGEIKPMELPRFEAAYRFFFHPIRYTSLGLAVCEAMTIGLPVVGLATTELPAVLRHGESGYVSTNQAELIDAMQMLLSDAAEARRVGENGRRVALERFNIKRFTADWDQTFREVVGRRYQPSAALAQASGG